ncbi:MAG: autotransporter-associated beta strand repeat-containing protein [Akkermansiaceae bacterium]
MSLSSLLPHTAHRLWDRRGLPALLAVLLLTTVPGCALTYQLAGGNTSWPADKRAAIVSAMNAAVALYNANGYFPRHLTANYNAGVPTAQANYSGWIDFGGSISTRVALHEISHTLGVGTYWNWDPKRNTSTKRWTAPRALARLALFDGAGAVLNADGAHFWPYGLNYDYEDSTTNRVRHIKLVSAMRWDMGIVTDSDNDGMPDDWELFHFGDTWPTASGDFDGDGVSNLSEYNADTIPGQALAFTWNGGAGTWNTTTPNWTGGATLWRNGGHDTATFSGVAGTVTVVAGTMANDIIFNTSGYEIAGSSLALSGQSPTVTTASGVTASIMPTLSGSGGLVKNGAGTLTLAGASTFTGSLTVNQGILAIAPGGRLYMNGGSTVTTINSGATLTFTGNWGWDGTLRYMGVQEEVNIINGGTLQHSGAGNPKTSAGAGRLFTIGTAGATLDSATAGSEFSIGYRYDYGSALASLGGTLTLTGAGDGDLNYNIPGAGALVKRGAGIWKLTGASNSFSGGATIGVSNNAGAVGGILQINDSTSLGSGAVTVIAGDPTSTHQGAQLQLTGDITLANPAITISGLGFGATDGVIHNLSGNNTITGAVRLTTGAGGSVIGSAAGKLTLGSGGITAIVSSRTLEFTGAGNIDVTGLISNGSTAALPVTKSGAGTLTFIGANTYSGATIITAGTLQIGANTNIGTLGSGAVTNDGILRFHRNDATLVVPNMIGGAGALEFGVSSGGALASETTLTESNIFTGAVTVKSGGLRITRAAALGSGVKIVTMTNGTNGRCRLMLDGSGGNISLPPTISFITSNADTTYPAIINEAGNNTIAGNFSLMSGGGNTRVRVNAGTLALTGQFTPAVSGRTLQLDGSASGTFSGALKNSGNTVGLEKFGTGNWTLTGSGHTYTGATTIHEGRLALAGNLASTIAVNGGIFAAQGSPSISGGLNLTAGGRFEIRINGTTPGTQYDRLTTSGSVTLGGALDILAGPGLAPGTDFTILNKTSAGAITGTFAGLPNHSVFTAAGYLWSITYTGGDGNDVVLHLATAQEQWRYQHFGTNANANTVADSFDANNDGESNLMEFATAQNPLASTLTTPSIVKNGATLELTYTRSLAAMADNVTFTVEWCDDLTAGAWSDVGVSEQILSDNGTVQTVRASVAAVAARRFLHLEVSKP